MSLIQRRARRLESGISICLLASLFLIGTGVFIKQFDVDMDRFGMGGTAIVQISSETGKMGLSSLAPSGFEVFSEIETYRSENLYEKINGKAPLYIESGFRELFTRRFVNKDDESLWMELFLYDMATVRGAFSVYSVQRRAEAELLPTLGFAYKGGNALYFVGGKYYIELVGSAESDELFAAMIEVVQKLQADLDIANDKIAELELFPQANLVQGSIKLYLKNAFGFEGLSQTFTCRYRFGDESLTAFFSRCAGPQQARTVAESYYSFLIDNGGVAKQTANKILEGRIIDFYGVNEIVFAVGPFVAGVHEAENQQLAERLAIVLFDKLK